MLSRGALAYRAMRLAAAVVPRLPTGWLGWLADAIGLAAYALAGPARRGLAANLGVVLDRADPDLVALRTREAFRTQAANYLDLFRVPRLRPDEIARLVEVVGFEHVEAARASGRGAIFAGVHLGNLDLVVQIAAARGLPVTIPVEPVRPPELLELVTRLRSAHGVRFVPVGPGAAALLARALRAGEAVGLAIDRDVQGSGAPVSFFGRPARLSTAPALLARRTGAAVLPTRCQRLPGGRYRIEIDRPLLPERGADDFTRRLVERIESFIRRTPGQWVMFQPLWARPTSISIAPSATGSPRWRRSSTTSSTRPTST